MGAFKGYFDESGKDTTQHNALAFCGYVGSVDGWTAFEAAWTKALADNGAPYLHMKELQQPGGELAAFAGKANERARSKLLGDLISVIAQSGLTCAGSLIRLPDLREFNAEYGMNIEALPLAMYATMGELYKLYPDDTLELVVDRLDKPERIIATAAEYASSLIVYDPSRKMRWIPLKGDEGFKSVIPIQAADFVAWEGRKEHERKNGWWQNFKRGLEVDDWFLNQAIWLGNQGKPFPNHRFSFHSLSNATKIHAGVIDYDFIVKHHREIRREIWTVEALKAYRASLSGRSS